jgi:amino acid adenylation domain-containing protein
LCTPVGTSADIEDTWVEDLPVPSTDPRAVRRRAAELARPAVGERQVLLRYADGRADLVVVSRRSGQLPDRTCAPAPAWGLGGSNGSGVYQQPLDAPGDEASWLTALAVTLRRYDPDHEPMIATADGAADDEPVLAALLFDDAEHDGQYVPCLAPPFPMTWSVFRDARGWQLRCDHLTSHISPEIVAQFARHLVHVHQQLPRTPVDDVVLLDEDERQRTVALGQPSAELATAPTTIHRAIARIAEANPDAVAVTDGAMRLTYRQLAEQATRLAHGLRARGVVPRDRVGVCLERTAEFVVTALAVLQVGATYVPLDPSYPAERLAYTTRDAGLRLVITRLAEFPGPTVSPDELPTGGSAQPAADVTPDDPAYIIYTSGSTGRPKGVVVSHRNVIALLDATRDDFALGAADVWTWFHSAAFDFSVWEIWGCLLTGGRLVVVPYFVSREPDEFRGLLAAEGVTVLSQTPSAFAQLLQTDHVGLAVRLVIFGGEPLAARMLLPWFDRYPESTCRVVNMFGITETTVHVTAQTITRAHALAGSRSVGRPLPGWQVYVLDDRDRLVPPGVAGEICVGDAGVALGYLGQAELTSQRFRPGPFADGVLYHSGDFGRMLPDGTLEHLGRIDGQIKIRGFRIELGEIRSVLLEDPAVQAAAVVVRHTDPSDPATARLDAYVVLPSDDTTAVRKRAAELLPEYMVPATVTAVDALPLTANGKLDVTKLPSPTTPETPPEESASDSSEIAERVRAIWSEILSAPVSLDDDFFELGGNSLYAVRLGRAMRKAGFPQVQLRDLYRHPTVRELAASMG